MKANTIDVVERLRHHRVILKSGEYDGADIMRAWCDMVIAADTIERLREELAGFTRAAYPVCTSINERGYNWCEAYLDQALETVRFETPIAAAEGGE